MIDPIVVTYVAVNFGAKKVTKICAKYKPESRFLLDPIVVTFAFNFSAK